MLSQSQTIFFSFSKFSHLLRLHLDLLLVHCNFGDIFSPKRLRWKNSQTSIT